MSFRSSGRQPWPWVTRVYGWCLEHDRRQVHESSIPTGKPPCPMALCRRGRGARTRRRRRIMSLVRRRRRSRAASVGLADARQNSIPLIGSGEPPSPATCAADALLPPERRRRGQAWQCLHDPGRALRRRPPCEMAPGREPRIQARLGAVRLRVRLAGQLRRRRPRRPSTP